MQITALLLEQGTYILEAAGVVPTLVLLIGAATLKGAAEVAAVEDTLGANTTFRLEVAAGVEMALVAAGALAVAEEATLLVAIALLAKPRVPALAPILVIEVQSLLREVPISAAC